MGRNFSVCIFWGSVCYDKSCTDLLQRFVSFRYICSLFLFQFLSIQFALFQSSRLTASLLFQFQFCLLVSVSLVCCRYLLQSRSFSLLQGFAANQELNLFCFACCRDLLQRVKFLYCSFCFALLVAEICYKLGVKFCLVVVLLCLLQRFAANQELSFVLQFCMLCLLQRFAAIQEFTFCIVVLFCFGCCRDLLQSRSFVLPCLLQRFAANQELAFVLPIVLQGLAAGLGMLFGDLQLVTVCGLQVQPLDNN